MRAPSTSGSRSSRSSGSPPVRLSCTTPRASASRKTRSQSSVPNASPCRAKSRGFEQYTQRSGQRYVSSATSVYGRGSSVIVLANQPAVRHVHEKVQHLALDRLARLRRVLDGEAIDDVGDGMLARAQLDDVGRGGIEDQPAPRIQQ